MAEMSSTIVSPVLFKQIARAEQEGERETQADGGRDKKRESAL